ncbi:hypothetical protein BO70DRAFT_198725 [Aspergillus heteromorphus CBS 117.55]|uniref:Uncharacterized protein n=1 Tax=Aspergillus heteromorphus CBS 117.55 TaxID=1448321 RepID=A0A317WPQ5_9EURO|nr:uncharacterized protein BO70DRAFT_198725 [Aspergillus heteromorphus CBS 117.55]PWY87631.1 hypothetical protein BO70DRAFT_198725 [Aspergillus heteromorphus CBS 117.55]
MAHFDVEASMLLHLFQPGKTARPAQMVYENKAYTITSTYVADQLALEYVMTSLGDLGDDRHCGEFSAGGHCVLDCEGVGGRSERLEYRVGEWKGGGGPYRFIIHRVNSGILALNRNGRQDGSAEPAPWTENITA